MDIRAKELILSSGKDDENYFGFEAKIKGFAAYVAKNYPEIKISFSRNNNGLWNDSNNELDYIEAWDEYEGSREYREEFEDEPEQPETPVDHTGQPIIDSANWVLENISEHSQVSHMSTLRQFAKWIIAHTQPETQVEDGLATCYFCHCQTMSTMRVDGHIMCSRCRQQTGR